MIKVRWMQADGYQQLSRVKPTTRRRSVVGVWWCFWLVLGCVVLAGCEERIVRDSRFSTFAKRYTVQEKPREAALPVRAVVRDPKLKEYDLAQFAGHMGRYSLQIGFWDETYREGRGDFRRAAEEQVMKLRSEGVEAYLFHGPLRSMVTVQLFGEADLIRRADGSVLPGPRVAELQERFPYNLANGQPFRLTIFGKQQEDPQPSFVIEMPRPEQVGAISGTGQSRP